MMTKNRGLRCLEIDGYIRKDFPELIPPFRDSEFPKLTGLVLRIGEGLQLFTVPEMSLWGENGGSENLETLQVQYVPYMQAFIGKTPKLDLLNFGITENTHMDLLERYLRETNSPSPFGTQLDMIRFEGTSLWSWQTPPQIHHVVPWCLLKTAPTLHALSLFRPQSGHRLPGSTLGTATAQDIHDIRDLCRDLTHIKIDVAISFTRTHAPIIPDDIFQALAQFKAPIRLYIYFHVHKPRTADLVLNRSVYYGIFHALLDERERLGLPCHPPFEAAFKIVRIYKDLDERSYLPDYRLTWPEGSANFKFEKGSS
jgi:hypothetical protein